MKYLELDARTLRPLKRPLATRFLLGQVSCSSYMNEQHTETNGLVMPENRKRKHCISLSVLRHSSTNRVRTSVASGLGRVPRILHLSQVLECKVKGRVLCFSEWGPSIGGLSLSVFFSRSPRLSRDKYTLEF